MVAVDGRSDRDRDLIERLEAHAVNSWPPTILERTADGWVLRATPGLGRGRSNHALTPPRELEAEEIAPALERIQRFAQQHGIKTGIQVSPLHLHMRLKRELHARGWRGRWQVLVMTGPTAQPSGAVDLETTDRATREWLETWSRCEPVRDVEAHAATVFERLRGRARFARMDDVAVAMTVEDDGLVGLFCLAVEPRQRRQGIATAVVRALLASATAPTAYLQVAEGNLAAVALYERLGFAELYRYSHWTLSREQADDGHDADDDDHPAQHGSR
jgi:ribosomal protein S18 acetylase RimI-like enzyme